MGEVEIALAAPLAVDLYEANPRTGRIVLEHGGRIAGGGLVLALPAQAKRPQAAAAQSPAPRRLEKALSGLDAAARLAAFRSEVAGRSPSPRASGSRTR